MNNTTNTELSAFDKLMEQRAYKEFIEHFSDTIVSAEDVLTSGRIAEGILYVLQEQKEYHEQKVKYYTNILQEFYGKVIRKLEE